MKRWLALLGLSFFASFPAFAGKADDSDSGLFYATEENMRTDSHWETRLLGGTDFSNSFLSIYGVHGGVLYLAQSSVAFGVEGGLFFLDKKGSGERLADEMAREGYLMHAIGPSARAAALIRVTPLSGMVNLFSQSVMKVDLSLVARVGVIKYQVVGWGPTGGLAMETLLGLTPGFGVNVSLQYDIDKPPTVDFLWRAGVMIGPSFRF